MAKAIATTKGMTTGEYIAEIIGPVVKRDYAVILRQFEKGGEE